MTKAQIETLKNLEAQIKELQKEADKIKDELKKEIGSREAVEFEGYTLHYSTVISTTLDSKKLKEELPTIWDKYSKEGITRRFSISVNTNN